MTEKQNGLFSKTCLGLSVLCLMGVVILGLITKTSPLLVRALGTACPILFAASLSKTHLKGFRFTVLIVASVVAAMCFPEPFNVLGGSQLSGGDRKQLRMFIVQLVMFGMGTQMSLKDFLGVMKMPKAVIIGMACQFTIMPLVGFTLAKILNTVTPGLNPEIGAGIVLIGSCSSGLASNVMVYMAGANLALSVTLTAVAQLLAPFITPALMIWLAGRDVNLPPFTTMMMNIIYMVVIPIIIAFIYNALRKDRWKLLHNLMPVLSMGGIIYFTAITTAAGRDDLLKIGILLFVAAILHNTFGYILGYWATRLCGMDKDSCRTIAIEVGLQNGGLASGIASNMGKLATLGLAPAIFSPWMNVSGSVLANFWKKHKIKPESGGDS